MQGVQGRSSAEAAKAAPGGSDRRGAPRSTRGDLVSRGAGASQSDASLRGGGEAGKRPWMGRLRSPTPLWAARAGLGVQAAGLAWHLLPHVTGRPEPEPASPVIHYSSLHLPLHVGILLVFGAAIWAVLIGRRGRDWVGVLAGATIQLTGAAFDAWAVASGGGFLTGEVLMVVGAAVIILSLLRLRAHGRTVRP